MDFDLLAAAEGRPLNYGSMVHASAHARITGECGDTVQFWVKIDEGRVRKASFVSDGCEASLICCSTAAHMAEDRLLEEIENISTDNILDAAPLIPAEHRHCASLAADTIRQAITEYHALPAKGSLKQRLRQCFHLPEIRKQEHESTDSPLEE